MKKLFLIGLFCFISSKGFSQTGEIVSEEKSSAWIKISSEVKPITGTRAKAVTTTPKKNTAVQKPVNTEAKPPKSSEEFDKTNSKVKRFKKG